MCHTQRIGFMFPVNKQKIKNNTVKIQYRKNYCVFIYKYVKKNCTLQESKHFEPFYQNHENMIKKYKQIMKTEYKSSDL